RNRREREARDRLHGIARELREPRLAAEKQPRADDIEREKCESNRQAQPHDDDEAAEQDQACFGPAHYPTEVASLRRVAGAPTRRWKRKMNSSASNAKQIGRGASSHHSGKTRFLIVIEPSRALCT